ncbi:MAG: transcriptional regulator [Dethiobacteria bacterium]|nr:transcriptional regulator [Bacillota bacterium]
MDFYRIGEKLISLQKLNRLIDKVFKLRMQGFSQQETAQRLNLDRSFISRLETLGEVRKGKKIAVIGFPLKNLEELEEISDQAGVDFTLFMNNKDRWELVQKGSGLDFFERIMQILTVLKEFDLLVLISSKKWFQVAEALFDKELVFLELGRSPIEADCHLDPARYKRLISELI